ncbi:LuxR family maltose regulon positive regulatory protein [Tamilnaduibacter salinus]|uniref:LuxR family maltose regulon positive regulatory protein n=1 Tax=Tamilnaduibacter salinus TaxID=1484056 RepID=A0A2U1CZQ0_9GAMM|nr:LuxR C-terminal-related transcriptional regulator [Tamilnaduibacter salinus]PVY78268.1 LuxR family maltose regulon positive regulatory protein [Tamilnaduibacter salinus]
MLLTTKFFRPAPDPDAIRRPRLLERLAPRTRKRLNLVIAPAGFGKTTLVSQWCDEQEGRLAWLSLDSSDDDPRRFWQYLCGAFEQAGVDGLGDCQSAFQTCALHEIEGAITGLINALVASAEHRLHLVLDDMHEVEDPAIHRQLTYLVDYLPPTVMVTLVSRTEPALPVARWRVRHWVDDVPPQMLAFSEEECQRFFSDYMAIPLDADQARTIWQRTEGWVAAMQLSALSAPDDPVNRGADAAPSPISGREISDYILTEILEQQSDEIAEFLLATACCLRLTASLCDSIRGATDSQTILESLSRRHLFLIPLDTRDEWFRYHDLFREALFLRLEQTDPKQLAERQSRTIHWLLEHDHIQEAIAQLIQLEDWSWLANVLEQHGNNLIQGGFHLPVLEWLDRLPPGTVDDNPQLAMLRIWANFFANRLDAVEPQLDRLEDLLDRRVAESHPDAEGALGLNSEISLMRSYLARTQSDLESAADLTRQVLQDLDHTQMPLKSVTYYGIGLDYFSQGDLPAAEEALQSAVSYGQIERKPSTVLSSGGLLSWIQFNRGHNDVALKTAVSIREWIDRHYTDPSQPRLISCWQNCSLIEIYRERDQLDLAETYLAPLTGHLQSGTEPGQHVIIQYARAHLAFTRGDYQTAIEALDDAEAVLERRRDHIIFEPPSLSALRARCWLAQNRLDDARGWLDSRENVTFRNPLNREQNRITAARVLIALGEPKNAISQLSPLRLSTERDQHHRHLIEVLTVYAEAMDALNQPNEAQTVLTEALKRGAREQFFRLFVEESPRIHRLIGDNHHAAIPQEYLEALKSRLPESDEETAAPSEDGPVAVDGLVEPLSAREMEVLRLINDGLANREIAESMNVAATTVKAHIRNLYGKLDVKSRTEALARARKLGVLS